MHMLEAEGRLDRAVEYLPDDSSLTERGLRGEGLTRPEIAVLLAYAKLSLYDRLLESSVPDDPYLGRELQRYFPSEMRERFPDTIDGHRLRREIIATQLSNAIVNRGGPNVIARLVDETGADAPTIAAAYASTRDSFRINELNAGLDALDCEVTGALQLRLYGEVQDLSLNRITWFIRNVDFGAEPLEAVIGRFGAGVRALEDSLDEALSAEALADLRERAASLAAQNVPEALASSIAALPVLVAAPDITVIAGEAKRPIAEIAATYFAVDDAFKLGALVASGRDVAVGDYYDRLALDRAIGGVAEAHRKLTAEIAAVVAEECGPRAVALWSEKRGGEVARIRSAVDGIVTSGLTLSKLTVAASLLGDLARG
jgi:glutamate dehydrogenase